MKKIKIGLLGFGNVGTGTYEGLIKNAKYLEASKGISLEITKILVSNLNKKRETSIPSDLFTDNADEILLSPDIDIVVEVLGGIEPATSYMLKAMKNKKHVVTANKAAVAKNYKELIDTSINNNVEFKMEASVCGGIPVLETIISDLATNQINNIMGIVNGTTNYILTKMSKDSMSYAAALKLAQDKGFAEADPTADVEGIDAANKLSILLALAFNNHIDPKDIPTKGISKISMEEISQAEKDGKVIKLIAQAENKNGNLSYKVSPLALDNNHPLASVNEEYNAIFIEGNLVGQLMFYGPGAGPLPTGSAILGDIFKIAKMMI